VWLIYCKTNGTRLNSYQYKDPETYDRRIIPENLCVVNNSSKKAIACWCYFSFMYLFVLILISEQSYLIFDTIYQLNI
jgi:hypothetical protein